MELLQAGGFLFWVIIGIVVAYDLLAAAVDDEGFYGWAWLLTITATLYVVYLVHGTLTDKLVVVGLGAVIYLCLGTAWAFKKWVDLIKQQRAEALERYGKDWKSHSSRPTPTYYKSRIVSWIMFWPWSILWWVLTWPRHVAIWAYEQVAAAFDEVSNRMWN